jgi:hypothetical protein
MNFFIGIILISLGIYSLYRIFSGKGDIKDRLIFKHQIFLFEVFFGKENAYKALVIFTSTIEITFGLGFVFGKLSF